MEQLDRSFSWYEDFFLFVDIVEALLCQLHFTANYTEMIFFFKSWVVT